MRNTNELTHEEAIRIVQAIQQCLYLDTDGQDAEFWNPDKNWNGADVCQDIASVLAHHGLVPESVQPVEPDAEHPANELVAYAEQQGLESEDLDDFVHEVASKLAADNNNAGLDGQIEFLVDMIGAGQTRKELEELTKHG